MDSLFLILRIIGWTFLSLAGMAVFVLILPVTLRPGYFRGVFSLKIRLLFGWVTLSSGDKESGVRGKAERFKQRGEKKEKREKEEKKRRYTAGFFRRILPPARMFIARVLGHVKVRNVTLILVAKGGDPAKIGVTAGLMWEIVSLAAAAADGLMDISYERVLVIPDFGGGCEELSEFDCQITVVPVILLVAALALLLRMSPGMRTRDSG